MDSLRSRIYLKGFTFYFSTIWQRCFLIKVKVTETVALLVLPAQKIAAFSQKRVVGCFAGVVLKFLGPNVL